MNDALNPARKNKQRIRIKRKSEFDKGGGNIEKFILNSTQVTKEK